MGLPEGLCLYFPNGRGKVSYPAGDEGCPEAIGRLIKDGHELTMGDDKTEIRFGYILKVVNNRAVCKDSGYWDVIYIKRAEFDAEEPGIIRLLVVDVRRTGKQKIHEGIKLVTERLNVSSLFD